MADPYPLRAQTGIWAGQQLDPASPAYNAGEYVDIRGPLSLERLIQAIRSTIDDAPALQPFSHPWDLPVIQVSTLAEALDWMNASLSTPVDLATGPLFTQAIFRLDDEWHLWYQQIHHIAADGYAFHLLADSVASRYSGNVRPFGSYEAVLAEDTAYDPSADKAFWLSRMSSFAAAPPAVSIEMLPLRAEVPLPRLGNLAVDSIAAVAGLHARMHDTDEAIVGLPVMGRLGSAALRVPCMWMNIVPLRISVGQSDTLTDLAAVVKRELASIRPHSRYRYEQLRRDLGLVGRRLFGPVVNVLPFRKPLSFAAAQGEVHNVSAGPVEDLSYVFADRLTVEANPALHTMDSLQAHVDELLALLGERGPVRRAALLDGGLLPTPPRPVLDLIAAQAEDRIALVASDLGRLLSPEPQESSKISYRALRHAIGEQASALRAAGARAGRIVAVELARSPEAIIAILAVLQTGAAYLPLDPSAPPSRNEAILADARPVAIFNESIVALDDPREIEPAAYVIYTSGSTGTPNGVVVGHEALNHFVAAATARYGITEDDRVLQFAPLQFDASVEEIFLTLCAGATLVLRPDEISVPSLLEACQANQISVLDLPTAYWHELAYVLASGAATLPSSIRTVIIGGEAALPDRVARWREAVPDHVKLLNTYGPTETTVVAVTAELSQVDDDVPIGKPLPGVRAAVRDGELWLLGPTLAQGYLGQPELTARRFADHEGSRAYRTGDLVRLNAGGELVFAGRADDELKISGHRIDPAAVESVLLNHPDVVEVAVVGQPLATGGKRLTAFVVLGKEGDLRSHAARTLPAAAVPTAFVRLERLPRTSTGKIDRNALRDFSPPILVAQQLTQTEALVLRVWAEVLGPADLAVTDDFFARGGQSLQTIQVASRLSIALGRSIPATLVFANPSAAMLAATLDGGSVYGSSVAVADFRADTMLPPDVVPAPARTASVSPTVMLTGATGFVGAHLLAELPGRIICAIRGDTSRLAKALDRWQVKVPGFAERVRVVGLDLAQPFTFDEHVDAIYHSAATVSVVRGYSSMRPVNVDATLALLRLAATHGAAFHHVSTLAVANRCLTDGYQQTKWVAEELVRQAFSRDLRGGIYRLGRVAGSTSTAIVNPDDLVWRILRAGLPRGVLPALNIAEVWTPVDIAAQAIVSLSQQPSQTVHNLGSTVRLANAWQWCREYGYSFRTVPPGQWASAIRSSGTVSDDIEATLAFFDGPPVEVAEFPSGLSLPTVDQQLMHRYLDNAEIRQGEVNAVRSGSCAHRSGFPLHCPAL